MDRVPILLARAFRTPMVTFLAKVSRRLAFSQEQTPQRCSFCAAFCNQHISAMLLAMAIQVYILLTATILPYLSRMKRANISSPQFAKADAIRKIASRCNASRSAVGRLWEHVEMGRHFLYDDPMYNIPDE